MGARKAATCLACHGANGTSAAQIFPRLAGQRADYLYHRLVSFKRASPKDPYYATSPMLPMVANLTDTDLKDLAAFFASQTPEVNDVASASAAAQQGEALFHVGNPSRGIPPCQGCHGADASGAAERTGQYAAYPALRGQYAPYVTVRLMSFRNGLPRDTTSDMIMGGVAHTLDDPSIQAIAAWLSSLPPAKSL